MVRLLRIILIVSILYSSYLFSDDKIAGVSVDGNVDNEQVLSQISLANGDVLKMKDISDIINTLYETGRYDYIEAVTAVSDDGVRVKFNIIQRKLVNFVKIIGNHDVEKDDIDKIMTIKEGDYLDRYKLWQSASAIKKLYKEKDHPMVNIDWDIVNYPDTGTTAVTFSIKEYKNIPIAKIIFNGNKHFNDKQLKSILNISEHGPLSWLTSKGNFDQVALEESKQRVVMWYMDHGYIDVKVDEPVVILAPDRSFVKLVYAVNEGKQYKVGRIFVSGDLIFDRLSLIKSMKLKENEVFNRSFLSMDLYSLINRYKDVGYFFVQVIPNTDTDKNKRIININYNIKKGNLVYIRFINITGNNKSRDKVIRRQMTFAEEELYSGRKIKESRERIFALGYFEEVNLRVETVSKSDNLIDVVVEVKEKPTGTASAGIAYSSVDKIVGTLQLSFGNFMGYGQHLSLMLEYGENKKSYDLQFSDPYFLDSKWGLNLSLFNTSHIYTEYTEDTIGGTLGTGYQLTRYLRFFTTYSQRKITIDSSNEGAMRFYSNGRTGSMTFSLAYNSKNHPYDPSKGIYTKGSFEYGSKYLAGDYNFIKGIFSSSYYFSPFWGITLMFHGEVGEGFDLDGSRLPFSERFLLGGIYSVRGYDYMTLGPRELVPYSTTSPYFSSNYINIGGNKELMFNSELLLPILPEAGLKWVFFIDGGNAYAEEEQFFARPLRWGWGFGLRWFSPMGPLRFEWSYPINPREGDRNSIFEFNIGTFF